MAFPPVTFYSLIPGKSVYYKPNFIINDPDAEEGMIKAFRVIGEKVSTGDPDLFVYNESTGGRTPPPVI